MLLAGLALLGLAAVLLAAFAVSAARQPVVINQTAVPPLPGIDRHAAAEGERLYAEHCASCHGLDLSGVADWKTPLPEGGFPPPPHDDSGHTWHHPDFLLLQIMAEGGAVYDGAMPGFEEQLSETEMAAILEFLKSRWNRESREFQWWITNIYPTPTPGR